MHLTFSQTFTCHDMCSAALCLARTHGYHQCSQIGPLITVQDCIEASESTYSNDFDLSVVSVSNFVCHGRNSSASILKGTKGI